MKDLGKLRRAGRSGWLGWSGWSGWWMGVVVLGLVLPVYGQYGPGTGEPNDPYQIWDPNQMNAIGANSGDWGKCFKLMADIDLDSLGSDGFQMIGVYVGPNNTSNIPFSGKFDGNGHSISNFTYTAGGSRVGLFTYVEGLDVEIKNLTLINPYIKTGENIGSLAACFGEGHISNCHVMGGTIQGSYNSYIGGLVGGNGGIISRCSSSVNMRGPWYLGGLVGNNGGSIVNCISTSTIFSTATNWELCLGGIAGYNTGTVSQCFSGSLVFSKNGGLLGGLVGKNIGTIDQCYSESVVWHANADNQSCVGGLVGLNGSDYQYSDFGTITNSYANSIVKGYYAGGLVGHNSHSDYSNRAIYSCYSTSRVFDTPNAGGFAGWDRNYVFSGNTCFWDMQASGLDHSHSGTGLTAAEMVDKSIFKSAGWDFSTPIWRMEDGLTCPMLAWEDPNDKIGYGGGTGSAGDPYRIYTPEQMQEIGLHKFHWNRHFQLMNDIDIGCYDGRDGREAFHLISMPFLFTYDEYYATYPVPFFGSFNGNGHRILNFTWNDESLPSEPLSHYYVWNSGLFCEVGGTGQIQNLALESVYLFASIIPYLGTATHITHSKVIGGLVGENEGIISNCHISGKMEIIAQESCGGVAGFNNAGGIIKNCGSDMELIGYDYGFPFNMKMGGITGGNGKDVFYSEISDCKGCYIQNCYAMGNYTINSSTSSGFVIGGITGYNYLNSIIVDSYSLANLEGYSVGGIAAYVWDNSSIINCYATGCMSGEQVGGIVGYVVLIEGIVPIVANSFWDLETSGQTGSLGGKGLTTEQMKTMSIYQNAGWADHGWIMDDGVDYPRLSWEGTEGVPIPSSVIPFPGSGTAGDPYLITTAEEFSLVSWYGGVMDKQFRLTADLDLNGMEIYPIGDLGPFRGLFDGKGHTIINASINEPGSDCVGLFSFVGTGGQIQNLGVENEHIIGRDYVGGLVGRNSGLLSGCYTTGSVSGNQYLGGLAGIDYSMITNCYATVSVSGARHAGGLVGYSSGTIASCFATGSVNGTSYYIGGLVGYMDSGLVTTCYSTGFVTGSSAVGGLVGGKRSGAVDFSFWDTQTSGHTNSPGGIGKTTAEMMTLSTFTGVGWDFTDGDGDGDGADWMMLREGEDYPRLGWQEVYGGDIAGRYGVDMEDLLEVAGNWLEEGCPAGCEEADINGDGRVDLEDFAVLAGNWLKE